MNSAGTSAVEYLKLALDAAEREQWIEAQFNAEEGAKNAETAKKIDGVLNRNKE